MREPAVAGRFYPADPAVLERDVAGYLGPSDGTESPISAYAVLAPHAGYVYSGAIAGETYQRVRIPDRVVLLCPNHTGMGVRRSVWAEGAWRLPGGDVPVNGSLARSIIDATGSEPDEMAHRHEHAIEVHLPFLRAKNRRVSIVPICLAGLTLSDCRQMGEQLAGAIRTTADHDVLLVASTDMSHYISAERARELDGLALERVQALDPHGLYEVVRSQEISMCGYIPSTVALFAAKKLGATRSTLVRYGNSGETSGDMDRVVGYAGVTIW